MLLMKGKNHSRAPGKKGFSIALPVVLIDQLQRIAEKETRSRNGQIERFLEQQVEEYLKSKGPPAKKAIPLVSLERNDLQKQA